MSLAPFAALEARVSAAVFTRLSNAVVSIAGGEDFGAVFDNDYALAGVGSVGMATTGPVLTVPQSRLPGGVDGAYGLALLVNGVAYTIAEVRPDGPDALLVLEVAP